MTRNKNLLQVHYIASPTFPRKSPLPKLTCLDLLNARAYKKHAKNEQK